MLPGLCIIQIGFGQCYDTVGWCYPTRKIVPKMNYAVEWDVKPTCFICIHMLTDFEVSQKK